MLIRPILAALSAGLLYAVVRVRPILAALSAGLLYAVVGRQLSPATAPLALSLSVAAVVIMAFVVASWVEAVIAASQSASAPTAAAVEEPVWSYLTDQRADGTVLGGTPPSNVHAAIMGTELESLLMVAAAHLFRRPEAADDADRVLRLEYDGVPFQVGFARVGLEPGEDVHTSRFLVQVCDGPAEEEHGNLRASQFGSDQPACPPTMVVALIRCERRERTYLVCEDLCTLSHQLIAAWLFDALRTADGAAVDTAEIAIHRNSTTWYASVAADISSDALRVYMSIAEELFARVPVGVSVKRRSDASRESTQDRAPGDSARGWRRRKSEREHPLRTTRRRRTGVSALGADDDGAVGTAGQPGA